MAESFVSVKLEGGDLLERAFRRIGDSKTSRAIWRKGVRAGAKVFQPAVKANALSMVGGDMGSKIAGKIVVRALRTRRRGEAAAGAMINPSAYDEFVHTTRQGQRHFIPSAIEFGHAFPGRGGGKHSPKDVPAIPFAFSAYISHRPKAAKAAELEMWAGIKAALAKQAQLREF